MKTYPHPTLFIITLLFVMAIFLTGCYGTKFIPSDDKAMSRKNHALLHAKNQMIQIRDIHFTDSTLTGTFNKYRVPPVIKTEQVAMLDVYLMQDCDPEIDTTGIDPVSVPLKSIEKIERTRFRFEYLLAIPVLAIILIPNLGVTGSSF